MRYLATIIILIACLLILPVFSGAKDDFHYIFPVQPVAKASFSQGGHGYPAIDIFTHAGAHFVAPVSGVIEDIKREDTYDPKVNDPATKGGRWVSLVGDDGYRYYGSHLQSVSANIKVGQKVKAGKVLGVVGKSGNAAKTPRHLHFGISNASRPYTWKVRRGEIDPYHFLKCLNVKNCDPLRALKEGRI